MRITPVVFCVCLGALVACGGGDDGGGDGTGGDEADAAPMADASSPDAGAVEAFGLTCDQTAQDCPGEESEYLCVNISGGTNPWCTKECTTAGPAVTPECGPHPGPGVSRCLFSLMMEGGGTLATVCGIVCADPTGQYCPAGECDETCPGSLACTQAAGDMVPEGFKVCQ